MEELLKKLTAVVKKVGAIEKGSRNDFHKYSYRSHEDIVNKLQPALLSEGILIVPGEKKVVSDAPVKTARGESNRVVIECNYNVTDGKNTLHFCGLGEGMDSGDKAIYKAQTGAMKYALNDLLMLASESDPEADIKTDQNGMIADPEEREIAELFASIGYSQKQRLDTRKKYPSKKVLLEKLRDAVK